MTHYEKTPPKLREGDEVKHHDDGTDGHPVKWVNGKVIGVGDEGFEVQWEDLPWPTDYNWSDLKGEQIIDSSRLEYTENSLSYWKKQAEDLKIKYDELLKAAKDIEDVISSSGKLCDITEHKKLKDVISKHENK